MEIKSLRAKSIIKVFSFFLLLVLTHLIAEKTRLDYNFIHSWGPIIFPLVPGVFIILLFLFSTDFKTLYINFFILFTTYTFFTAQSYYSINLTLLAFGGIATLILWSYIFLIKRFYSLFKNLFPLMILGINICLSIIYVPLAGIFSYMNFMIIPVYFVLFSLNTNSPLTLFIIAFILSILSNIFAFTGPIPDITRYNLIEIWNSALWKEWSTTSFIFFTLNPVLIFMSFFPTIIWWGILMFLRYCKDKWKMWELLRIAREAK